MGADFSEITVWKLIQGYIFIQNHDAVLQILHLPKVLMCVLTII